MNVTTSHNYRHSTHHSRNFHTHHDRNNHDHDSHRKNNHNRSNSHHNLLHSHEHNFPGQEVLLPALRCAFFWIFETLLEYKKSNSPIPFSIIV